MRFGEARVAARSAQHLVCQHLIARILRRRQRLQALVGVLFSGPHGHGVVGAPRDRGPQLVHHPHRLPVRIAVRGGQDARLPGTRIQTDRSGRDRIPPLVRQRAGHLHAEFDPLVIVVRRSAFEGGPVARDRPAAR